MQRSRFVSDSVQAEARIYPSKDINEGCRNNRERSRKTHPQNANESTAANQAVAYSFDIT
jgi:hypothetical protein